MNLDILASFLCGAMAVALFLIHNWTSPRHSTLGVPEHVRIGVFATGGLFMVRSVNFATLPPPEILPIGHINGEGLITLALMFYTIFSIALWLVGRVRERQAQRVVELTHNR